jgi:hypothetical protein
VITSPGDGEMNSIKPLKLWEGREEEEMLELIGTAINSVLAELFPCFEGAVDRAGLT